jgi:hypothetical protein
VKVWVAAIAVLRETKNPAVMWGDSGLLHRIADRAGHPARDRSWKTENAVLQALSRNHGALIAGKTTTGAGREVRIFRLPGVEGLWNEGVDGVWQCPDCKSWELCEADCPIAPWNQ